MRTRTRLHSQEPEAPKPDNQRNFKTRPFSDATENADASAQQQPNLQAQLEHAERFGHNLSRFSIFPPQVQAKLTVGEPNDQYEQEADRVADQVMGMPTPGSQPSVQRQDASEEEEAVNLKPLAGTITPLIQRQDATEEEETDEAVNLKADTSIVQRQDATEEEETEDAVNLKPLQCKGNSSAEAGSDLEAQLGQSQGGGSPLSEDVRGFMEPRFGNDFSGVRIHTDSNAVQMNQELGAQAFTHGQDLYFNTGKYDPDSHSGKQLLAHELTHVVQQTGKVQARQETPQPETISISSSQGTSSLQRKFGDGHDLTSARFSGDEVLEGCYDGEKARYLRFGSKGEAVKKIQQALIDLGYPLPISTQKTGEPDGILGSETKKAIEQFQTDQKLTWSDGVIGGESMSRLDQLLGSKPTPKKEEPEIDATEEAMGKRVADDMDAANKGPSSADEGIHYARNYREAFPDRWKDDYYNGYANPTYFDRNGFMDWQLKPKASASEAIKSWLKGLTIAECFSTVIAIEYDTIRAAIGDAKFDKVFGSVDTEIPPEKRLRIATPNAKDFNQIPLNQYMKPTDSASKGDEGTINNRPVKVGEWYYFYNHPMYRDKHPAGEWQGENSIYMGKNKTGDQLWSGLGTLSEVTNDSQITEDEMMNQMVSAYNGDRDSDDNQILDGISKANGGALPPEYRFEDEGGVLPRVIDKNRILTDPPYKAAIDGATRKGGFVVGAGQTLDVDKIKELREEK
jgi:peptidoglycan hydrolase-like protein with peptidoglycan-binding domain